VTVAGRLERPGCAIDVRLQSHRWMNELEARGGRVVIENVTVERLDAIAAENDLTIVAAGKAALANVFPRDAARSRYDRPARHVCFAVFATDRTGFDGVPYVPVKFDILAGAGEAFFAPFFHKDVGAQGWNVLIEAVPGGPLDRFMHVRDGRALLDIARTLYRESFPWSADMLDGAELADENGWLVGAITPTVREPVARLPSGRVVTAVGDTAMLFDPIGGQGANNGNKMAKNLVDCAVEHGERPFDEAFLRATFERFYARHGAPAYAFNNLLLEPPSLPALAILIAQYGCNGLGDSGRQRLADAFAMNFDDPSRLHDVLASPARACELVTELTGMPWYRAIAGGAFGIARAQVRRLLGRPMGHPSAPFEPARRPARMVERQAVAG
jgi:hypothetical protein